VNSIGAKSKPEILIIVVVFFAMLALLGAWQGTAWAQQGQATESNPAPAQSSQEKNANPQDQKPAAPAAAPEAKSSGGERLSKKEVSTLPLNKRDFSQLLLLASGTGPNQGAFGTLGRNTFRGPGFHDWDFSLIKDTSFGRRGNTEAMVLRPTTSPSVNLICS